MTFEEFVAARLGAILRYATVVAWDRHLAEDITQDVLARAALRWARIGRLEAPELYVKRMVLNEFLSWRRRRSAVPVSSVEPLLALVSDPTHDLDERDAMVRLIGALPAKQRAVVALRFYEDLSVYEIATLMGARPTTVRTHLARALESLRTALPSPTSAAGSSTASSSLSTVKESR